LLLFFLSALLHGQDASLTTRSVVNADVVEMSRAELMAALLIAKNKNSQFPVGP